MVPVVLERHPLRQVARVAAADVAEDLICPSQRLCVVTGQRIVVVDLDKAAVAHGVRYPHPLSMTF